MRKALLIIFALLAVAASTSAANEYYIEFKIYDRAELGKLTRIMSIDNVQGDIVRAYANDSQMDAFEAMGYEYTKLTHPGKLIVPEMSDSRDRSRAWDVYPTYDAYVSIMNQFAANYPDICRLSNIGTTVEGRQLLFAKISDNVNDEEDEPEFLYTSSMHGDEITGYVLTLRLIDSLLVGYTAGDPRIVNIVDNMEIWINPAANPDGTYAGGNNSVYGATRYNANSYDLNRNFPDPEDGTNPNGPWQPETIAMMGFADDNSIVLSANFHGGAEVMNYPWDTWSRRHADDDWMQFIYHKYADTCQVNSPSGYMNGFDDGITNGYDWYSIAGGRQDYMTYFHGAREVTAEISDTKLIPASQLTAHWGYNRLSLLTYMEDALYGIRGIVTDAITTDPVAATISIAGHDIDNSAVFTDPDIGDYHRMIAPGTYDLTFSAPGYYDTTIYSVPGSYTSAYILDVAMNALPNEPVFTYGSNDAGPVDPGDAVSMHITLVNIGAGNASSVVAALETADSYVTVTQDLSAFPNIVALGGEAVSTSAYEFSVLGSCPLEHVVDFSLIASAAGGFVDTLAFSLTVGQMIETFESGDFTVYDWTMDGHQPWVTVTSDPYQGTYCGKSGSITHNQYSTMEVTVEDLLAGEISFFYKVSSEGGYDYLQFYIDGVMKDEWSDEVPWTQATYAVGDGNHTFKWTYDKDGSVSDGSDCAWVDNIIFPGRNQDPDGDGFDNGVDNCPETYNPGQEDGDTDGTGDICDNCPVDANTDQADTDNDTVGDVCDNCAVNSNTNQSDGDADSIGDICDNCPAVANVDQADGDSDTVGDACDNCPAEANSNQADADDDTVGDACDNCPAETNSNQTDIDVDTIGDVCDNCPSIYNPDQTDTDENGVGDACQGCCLGMRGNINGDVDDNIDVSDLTYLVDYLFGGGSAPPCPDEADVNASGGLDVSDLTYLVDYLFSGGPAPANCI